MHHDEIIRAELSKVSHLPFLIAFQTLTQLDPVFQQHMGRQKHTGREGGMQLATEGQYPGAVVEGLLVLPDTECSSQWFLETRRSGTEEE